MITRFWVSKDELKRHSRAILPGKKSKPGGAHFRANALGLGNIAKMEGEPAIAILFRDSDRTRSSERSQWNEQWKSFEVGFEEAGFDNWIGLLPNPKSEAWLLCAMQEPTYHDCGRLESLSGNDASPNSLKKKLAESAARLGVGTSAEELAEWVRDSVEVARLDMPSWNVARERVAVTLRRLGLAEK